MDFDRCSGEFNNPITIYNQSCPNGPSCSGSSSVEISPNNRFVYVSTVITLNQYDLYGANLQDSVQLYADSVDHTQLGELNMLQLAPNGKIYLSTWNGLLHNDSIHVINNPDAKGDSCNFRYASQLTYNGSAVALPNMANYKLGPLRGSGCDTITSAITETQTQNLQPRIIPNPANKYAYIEMGAQGNYQFELLNEAGQVVDRKETKQVDIFDTAHLSSGVYILRVIDKTTGVELAAKKVVVVH